MSGERPNIDDGIDTRRTALSATRPSCLTELDYLEEEAASARNNMQDSCRQIGRSIKKSAGRVWADHPIMVSVAAAGLAGLGVAWVGRSRQRRTTKTIVTEVDTPREHSLLSRAGGLIGKTLISLLLARLTSPPDDDIAHEGEGLTDSEAAA